VIEGLRTLLATGPVRIAASGVHAPLLPSIQGQTYDTRTWVGIIEMDLADQVVTVRSGTPLAELNAELAGYGQTIPLGRTPLNLSSGTVGGLASVNAPHSLESQLGSWRDWVLGMTIVRADGVVAKVGSRVVKSVAGYDVQRLMVGARGTLGAIVDITLRMTPIRAVPQDDVLESGALTLDRLQIQRVSHSEFERVTGTYRSAYWADRASGTIWSNEMEPPASSGGWLWSQPAHPAIMERAKSVFDPMGKLNPGAF